MTQYAAVTPQRHAKKKWRNVTDYTFATTDAIIPLVGAELGQAALAMPTGFIKHEDGYQLVAVTSLQSSMNLYVSMDGQWLGNYIPCALRAYPFRMLKPEDSNEPILCVDEVSGLLVESDAEGNGFFDEDHQPVQKVTEILNFLSEVEANRTVTKVAVNALSAAGLITPWKINLKQGEEVVPVKGLFHVDEAALNNLSDDAFLELRKAGALALAYAQLLSMNQLGVLERLGQLRGQMLEQQNAPAEVTNLGGFSLSEDHGSLKFD